jgi:hypothetical protein
LSDENRPVLLHGKSVRAGFAADGCHEPSSSSCRRERQQVWFCPKECVAKSFIRPVALGQNNWLFAGSDHCGERAAAILLLIETAKLNGLDPEAWLRDALARITDHPLNRISDLLPLNWKPHGEHPTPSEAA